MTLLFILPVFFSTLGNAEPVQPQLRCWNGFNPGQTVWYAPESIYRDSKGAWRYGANYTKYERLGYCISIPAVQGAGEAALSQVQVSESNYQGTYSFMATLYFQVREKIRETYVDNHPYHHHHYPNPSTYIRHRDEQCTLWERDKDRETAQKRFNAVTLGAIQFLHQRRCAEY